MDYYMSKKKIYSVHRSLNKSLNYPSSFDVLDESLMSRLSSIWLDLSAWPLLALFPCISCLNMYQALEWLQ